MRWWLAWLYLSLGCSCYCANLEHTPHDLNYEEREPTNQEEDAFSGAFTETVSFSHHSSTPAYEDSFGMEGSFTTTSNLDENVSIEQNATEFLQENGTVSETPTLEEDWYTHRMESKLKIEYTPYSALLYQEDEFGLEFLCPGYWLEKDILLIRGDCWPKDVTFNIRDSVAEVFLKNDSNLMVLRLQQNLRDIDPQEELHLAHISDSFPMSINDCTLFVLQEDYAMFEKYSWASRPLPFKRARGLCRENHICIRIRPSAAYGLDYALLCGQTFTGMLTTDRTKYERVFGRVTLMNLSLAKPWIDQILSKTDGEIEAQEVTTFLSLSLTPMPPAEMHSQEGDAH